jgi:hypothetical protein
VFVRLGPALHVEYRPLLRGSQVVAAVAHLPDFDASFSGGSPKRVE